MGKNKRKNKEPNTPKVEPEKLQNQGDPPAKPKELKCGDSSHRCGLCHMALCVTPTHKHERENFYICGVCYNSEIYFPCDSYRLPEIAPESLYDDYITDRDLEFTCSFKDCSETFPLGEPSQEHMRDCEKRIFKCPVSKINQHYLPRRYFNWYCEFESDNPQLLYKHIKANHEDIMLEDSSIDSLNFKRRNHGLFVMDDEEIISIIYLDKASDNSLRITCRQMKSQKIIYKCIIKVLNEKYAIDCCDYCIGPPSQNERIILKKVRERKRTIEFKVVPENKLASTKFKDVEDKDKDDFTSIDMSTD